MLVDFHDSNSGQMRKHKGSRRLKGQNEWKAKIEGEIFHDIFSGQKRDTKGHHERNTVFCPEPYSLTLTERTC